MLGSLLYSKTDKFSKIISYLLSKKFILLNELLASIIKVTFEILFFLINSIVSFSSNSEIPITSSKLFLYFNLNISLKFDSDSSVLFSLERISFPKLSFDNISSESVVFNLPLANYII